MAKLTIDVDVNIKDGMQQVIETCLLKNGFDCKSDDYFGLLSRVSMSQDNDNAVRYLSLDGKVILHMGPVKIKVKDRNVEAYIEYYEPGNDNVTKQ